jgi:hypothetical protein
MKFALPSLELAPGSIICLHIPHGCDNVDGVLEDELLQLARRQGKEAVISQPAGFESGESSTDQSSVDWLSHAAGISEDQSSHVIAGLGIRVADRLAYNAGTPRCLMGLAATLAREPDVIAYSTAGLDAEGCRTVHRFIESRCGQLCAVHISYPTVFGDGSPHPRLCPPRGHCVELAGGFANLGHG